MTKQIQYTLRACALVLLFSLAAGGCSTQTPTVETLRLDMSPGFETIALSHKQRLIRQARAIDTTLRQLPDDVDKALLIYRPLRMTPYPIP